MIYDLVKPTDEILHTQTETFDFKEPPIDPMELFEDMKETMIKHEGLGLACPQVGLPYRMFVFGHHLDTENIVGVFNPQIVDIPDGKKLRYTEACLTYPDLYIDIKRPDKIRVRYTTHEGVTDTIKFDGLTSRIFQHEYDHLEGVMFTKVATKFHLHRAQKYRKLILRKRKRVKT
ncbi:MAG: peptide deformylase [Candidatus Pacebacteria bacterium]|nr:peptide deformylase [Candidatus Paceibacterota bacterium]